MRQTSGELILDLNILLGGHAEEGGDRIALGISVRETAAIWGAGFVFVGGHDGRF
jgi:hypothetical protein